jgi:hypothetical protein
LNCLTEKQNPEKSDEKPDTSHREDEEGENKKARKWRKG